jgi:urea transport system substrate-binding protein
VDNSPHQPRPENGAPDDLDFGQTIRGFTENQTVFGRFVLRRILGRGGMGLVWLAWDERLERDVALKFLPEMVVLDAVAIADLKRETRRSLDLTHPHIVRIHDFVLDGQSAAIAMEYVDGPTLSALRLQRPEGVFSPDDLAGWFDQLSGALEYAHDTVGIAHRDLKPANLLVNSRGQIKVTDFGISSSITDSVSRMSMRTGTSGSPPYMSPQQLLGEPPKVTDDIYSLGATLYELITSRPPFHRGAIYQQIKEVVPPSMTERRSELGLENAAPIPDAWEQTVAACLAKDPAQRPQSVREMRERLSGTKTTATSSQPERPDSDNEARKSPIWTKPKIALAFVVLLLAALGGAGWWFGAEQPRRAQQARMAAEPDQKEKADAQSARLADEERKADDVIRAAEDKRKAETAAAMDAEKVRVPSVLNTAGSPDTVKIGILHSLAGTMAISETSLRDILLFAVDEINASGGVLGKKLEPVVANGASNLPTFAEKMKRLLAEDKVSVVFGCWTSVSRKAVLPILEENNGLLFYPVSYEGEEQSRNIFYTAETINQTAIPAVDYLLDKGYRKFYLLGTDYVYPQTVNLVLLEYLLSKGVPIENIGGGIRKDASGKVVSAGTFTPFGHTDYQQIVAEIKRFAAWDGKTCVISTLNGDTNIPFFKEYAAAGLTAETLPVVSLSISEDDFRALPAEYMAGQLGCASYFQSLDSQANKDFVDNFQSWLRKTQVPGVLQNDRVISSPMALSYTGVYLWKKAVERAGSFDVDKVRAELEAGIAFEGPGGLVKSQSNMHLTKDVHVAESNADGQFKILKTFSNVYAEPWLRGKFQRSP